MSRSNLSVGALLALGLLAIAFLVVGAPDAFAAVGHVVASGDTAHHALPHLVTASLTVGAIRARIKELETRASAKMAEMKDGLTADQIRAVEAEHSALLGEIETARRDLAVAEEAERAAATAGGTPPGGTPVGGAPEGAPDMEVVRAQERMAERTRAADIRVTARKLGLGDAVADKAIADGLAIDAFRIWAIDERHRLQIPASWTTPPGDGGGDSVHRTYAEPATKVPPGTNAVRCLIALAGTRGNPEHAAAFVRKHYHESGEVVARALAASAGSTGGFLIPPDWAAEVIEFLRPASAVMSLKPEIVNMPRGQMLLPKQTSGAQASYVGEGQPASASQPGFGGLQLSAKKLIALVPISNDMIRFAGPQTDGLVRSDMVRAIAQRGDGAFLRGNGGQATPRGLRSYAAALGTTNLLTANATVTLQNVVSDLGRCELALEQANIVMERPGWVMAPRSKTFLQNLRDGLGNPIYEREMLGGNLRGKPFRVTTQIPTNLVAVDDQNNPTTDASEIYLADFAQVVVGEVEGLEIATFEGGTYVDGNGQLQSGISNDQTVMRAIVQHDLGLRHDEAVAVLTGVRWK